MGTSGVPEVISGINFGFTDFSEFAVAAGIPTGVTEFGITPTSPFTFAIVSDPAEGNYFTMDGQGFRSWGFGLDAFDGLMDLAGGELLARVFLNVPVNGRKLLGPAANMLGLVGQDVGGADFDNWSGGLFRLDPDELSGLFVTNNGSSSNAITVDTQEAWQDGEWVWIRARRVQNATNPGTEDDFQVTIWFGDILDEPAVVDGVNIGQARTVTWAAEAIGWAMPGNAGAETEQRIAFLSFSSDPTQIAPPVPSTMENEKPIILGPLMEYDARRLSSLADGDPVLLWPDSSPLGTNDAVPDPAPDHDPAFRPDRWAPGVPSVEFMDLGTSTFPPDNEEAMDFDGSVWQNNELTIFIVAQVIDISAGAAFIGSRFGGTPPRECDVCVFPDGTLLWGFGTETIPTAIQTNIITAAGLVKAGDKLIITVRHTNGAAGVSPEGMMIQVASVPSFVTDPVFFNPGAIGRSQNTGSPELGLPGGTIWGVDRLIGYIGGYALAATNQQILEMEAFLNEIWNVIPPTALPETPKPMQVTALWGAGALRDASPSGLIQTRNTKAAGWMFQTTWPLLSVRNFVHQALTTFLYTAWQRGQIFNAKHPLQPGSGLPPNGLGTATVQIDGGAQAVRSDEIITDGWPVSTQSVVRAGDAIKIDGDSGVYIVTSTINSNVGGGATLPITPPLRKTPADGAAVQTTGVFFRVTIFSRSQLEDHRQPKSFHGPQVTFVEALD